MALFFLPISYLMLVAGTFAVFSTSTNLVAQGLLVERGLPPLATFELGYLFHFNNGWELGTAFTNGVELNVKMLGEPVGEGWITLWQIRLNKRINLNGKQ